MHNETTSSAKAILQRNDKGGYTVPTGGLYPYQWNWDSVFVALGFATFDESRACAELETLFEAQWDDGFLPHIIFRQDDPDYFPGPSVWRAGGQLPCSGITQPPVAASILNQLWLTSRNASVRYRLAALFPKVLAWHRWFHRYRVPEETGAVTITHPWESGRDNSPEWDAPSAAIDVSEVSPYTRRDLMHADAKMRPTKLDYDRYIALVEFGRECGWDQSVIATRGPFRVADVGMTMILLRATRDLMRWAVELGFDDASEELQEYAALLTRGADYLWDDQIGAYCSRNLATGQHSGFITSASFLFGYADVGDKAQRTSMEAHWQRISSKAKFMVPSHDPDSGLFDDVRYWRGPIWIVVNYMIARGFEDIGWHERAERIRTDSQRLIDENGFAEAFSPVTGDGTGGTNFSWTAAMWLAWCGEQH